MNTETNKHNFDKVKNTLDKIFYVVPIVVSIFALISIFTNHQDLFELTKEQLGQKLERGAWAFPASLQFSAIIGSILIIVTLKIAEKYKVPLSKNLLRNHSDNIYILSFIILFILIFVTPIIFYIFYYFQKPIILALFAIFFIGLGISVIYSSLYVLIYLTFKIILEPKEMRDLKILSKIETKRIFLGLFIYILYELGSFLLKKFGIL